MRVDRAAHNADVFRALKPGGHDVIIDAHAKPGAGIAESRTLHRIEESLVIKELTSAGLRLVSQGTFFLRNPHDSRTRNALPEDNDREFSDKFALMFETPSP